MSLIHVLISLFPPSSSDEARSKKCGILVHCLAGISRSVTVTVAYLMQKLNLSLNDAYDFVKRKKSNISPNFNFMGQLLDFERTLGLNSPCDNHSNSPTHDQLFFTTPTNHNVFQLDTLESTWKWESQFHVDCPHCNLRGFGVGGMVVWLPCLQVAALQESRVLMNVLASWGSLSEILTMEQRWRVRRSYGCHVKGFWGVFQPREGCCGLTKLFSLNSL